ncbi:hypothetical protein [Jeotgalibacillus soli]|uniref:Amidohydrolase n=1 Tax=Jeotgalibacillus soli TaxID=889306 RepID=A0A0C2SDT4_9BACL|nr:hypothetical protein [Jeotgalibacillus soli]KIL52109.1 hypothetical protein KP78_04790 [Jeotgalibacillus soli]
MIALTNVSGFDGTGKSFEKVTILIENGIFNEISKDLKIPSNATVIDVTGKFVTPGLLNAHTHLGVHAGGVGAPGHDINETSDPMTV